MDNKLRKRIDQFNKAKSHFIGDEKKLVKEIKKEVKRHNLKKV